MSTVRSDPSAGSRRGSPVWRCGCLAARARAMAFIESARQTLAGWLESREALAARHAIESIGVSPDAARLWLQSITEEPSSSACIESLVSAARHCGAIPEGDVSIERWLLVRQGLDAIKSPPMARLANSARRLTCEVIVSLAQDDPWLHANVLASNVRFRELAEIVTGRRFCAGLFHWEECGIRRTWLFKVPPRDWMRFGSTVCEDGRARADDVSPSQSTSRVAASLRARYQPVAGGACRVAGPANRPQGNRGRVIDPVAGHAPRLATIGGGGTRQFSQEAGS